MYSNRLWGNYVRRGCDVHHEEVRARSRIRHVGTDALVCPGRAEARQDFLWKSISSGREQSSQALPGRTDEGVCPYVGISGLKIKPWLVRPFITTTNGESNRRCRTQPSSSIEGAFASHSQSTNPSPASGFTVKYPT